MRSHDALISTYDDKIVAVTDCFSGYTLRVLSCKAQPGEVIKTGGVRDRDNKEVISLDRKFWVIQGYSTWQTARAMANKAKSKKRLRSGVWHEVLSE